MRRFIVIGALFSLAVSGCANHKQRGGSANVTYEVTGSGISGHVRVRYINRVEGPQQKYKSRRNTESVTLPFRKEVRLGDYWDRAYIVANDMTPNERSATLTCTVKHDGTVILTKTGNSSVSCWGPQGSADNGDNN